MITRIAVDRRIGRPWRWLISKLGCGFVVDATTVGHHEFYLTAPTVQMTRHEDKHSEQASRFDAHLGPRWFRWMVGDVRFLFAYLNETRKHGYDDNCWEQEARGAEEG